MGRRSRNQQDLPLDKPARVRLSDEGRGQKSHRLAVVGTAIRGHRKELQSKTRDTRDAIKLLERERAELEDALIADEELKAQGQLFVAERDGPTKPQAQSALATVAAVAGEIKPSEPHGFEAVGGNGIARQMCKHCGSGKDDPIHQAEVAAGSFSMVVDADTTPGEVGPEESVELAKAHVSGNGKARVHRTPAAQKARARSRNGKAPRP